MRVLARAALFVLVAGTAACGDDSPASPSVNVPFSVVDLEVGTGPEAANGDTLNVRYTVCLYDPGAPENKGRQFDSGTFEFVLGAGQVIPGWDQGLVGMRDFAPVCFEPKPVQQPRIPIWVGGHTRRALRRTAKYGDAWHPSRQSPEFVTRNLPYLYQQVEAEGRSPDEIVSSHRTVTTG